MNILRELRKFKRRSVLVKLQILLLFSIMLIASTYAWWRVPQAEIWNIRATVETWDVEYNIDDTTILDEEVTISVDDFQPGMDDFQKTVSIRNLGTKGSKITYELTSVKLFGQEVLSDLQANNEIRLAGNTTNLFVNFAADYKNEKNIEDKYKYIIILEDEGKEEVYEEDFETIYRTEDAILMERK